MINETTTIASKDSTIYTLPKFLSELQHITTVDSGGLQFVICCDKLKLYIFPLISGGNKPLGSVHQSLPIPNIKSLRTIAKNFLMIQTQNKYLGIFQIIKSAVKDAPTDKPVNSIQANTVKVQFSEVLKWRTFSSYFIREVMENLFEVQVFFTDLDFEIFHFTNKNKKGSMSFTISQNGRILKSAKRQLYGSKFFFNIGRKLIYWMKNFSDKQFILQQIVPQQPMGSMKLQPFGYFGVQRAQEYKILGTNLVIRDCLNPAKRHSLQIQPESFLNDLKGQLSTLSPSTKKKNPNQQQNPFNQLVQRDGISQVLESYKLSIFTDLFMVENKQKKKMQIYQIRTEGSSIVAKQDSQVQQQKETSSMQDLRRWEWFFGNSKKLIGIDKIGFKLKYVQQMTLRDKTEQIKQNIDILTISEQKSQKMQEKKLIESKDAIKNQQQKAKNLQNQKKEDDPKIKEYPKDQISMKIYCEKYDEKTSQTFIKNLKEKIDFQNSKILHKSPEVKPKQQKQVMKQWNEVKKQQEKIKTKQKSQNNLNQVSKQKQKKNTHLKSQLNIKVQVQKIIDLNQGQTVVKQKPPMKIIQKNKISVAKSFLTQNQNESKQTADKKKQSKQEKQQNNSKLKEDKNIQKANLQGIIQEKIPKQSTQKKRFMQNYLSQEKKQQNKKLQDDKKVNQEQKKVKQEKVKESTQPKQEKKKINVITKASLLKKKQNQSLKESENKITNEVQNNKTKQNKTIQQKKTVSEHNVKTQIKQKKVQSIVNPNKTEKSALNLEQQKPKTRYIPSIDIKKASANQLNECQFLSQDSLSDQEEKTERQKQKFKKSVPFHEDQQIQQQIQGQSGYSSQQEDMEHLIDDDIAKKDTKVPIQGIKKKVNPDEDIEKFCNDLLSETSTPTYQNTINCTSSLVIKKSLQINSKGDKKISKIHVQTQQITISEKDKEATKQQTNQINQLNSLLFKTNIKRNNIFGSEEKSQEQLKLQQNKDKIIKITKDDKAKDNQQVKSSKQPEKIQKQEKQLPETLLKTFKTQEETNISEQKKVVQQKKSKGWHDLSSDSDDERSSNENQSVLNAQKYIQQIQENKKEEIKQTIQKVKKVESECSKILSDIEQHKTKEIQQKVFQQKLTKQPLAMDNVVEKTETKLSAFAQDVKFKPQVKLFNLPVPSKPISNPFLVSSTTPLFPTNTTPNWLSNRPPANLIQKKDQNPFINFKKSLQETQSNHHNLFGLGEDANGNSPNLLRKFLNQRQNKHQQAKQSETKTLLQKIVKQSQQLSKKQQMNQIKIKQEPSKQIIQKSLKSQSQFIPTTLLPKIQELITIYEQSTLTLLQKQQSTILKSLEEIPNTHNPYNKNHSLLLPEQIKQEIIKQSKNTVRKWLATKMLDKIESSFRDIMQEHKKVYEDALKYYEGEAKRRITTMQLQYEQQQTILTDIEHVAANLSSSLQGSVVQGEQMHIFQLKQWKSQITQAQNTLIQPLNHRIDDSKQFFNERNKNLQNLTIQLSDIKQILKNKIKKKQQIKENKKLKLQSKLKEQQNKKAKKIQQEPKKPKTQKVKKETQTSFSQFYPPPQYGQYEPQMYGRPPYPYY